MRIKLSAAKETCKAAKCTKKKYKKKMAQILLKLY